jgi:ABC-type oligopeptide transport system substrate-binding subunit
MKKTIMIAIACSLALGLTATKARADIALVPSGAFYVSFFDNPEPSSPALEAGYIDSLITVGAGSTLVISGRTYDRTGSSLTGLTPAGASSVDNSTGPYTGIGVTGNAYILGKYDGNNWGDYV